MLINNYLAIARNDLEFLEDELDRRVQKYPRKIAIEAQGICERYLKFIVENFCSEHTAAKRLLRTHDIASLYRVIKDVGLPIELNVAELAMLKDYYFNARYPGDSFYDVDQQQAKEAVKIVYDCKLQVENFLQTEGFCINCGSKLLETGECSNKNCDCKVSNDDDDEVTTAKSNVFNKE